jgi:hypothetical protein
MPEHSLPPGFQDMTNFGLLEAIMGRRSRRFFMGAEIPDGVFQFKSKKEIVPLSELEKLLIVAACGTNTGWNNLIYRAARYAPHLSNYAAVAGGRVFPTAAGFGTSMTFFTDDEGVYVLDCRDAPAFAERNPDGTLDFDDVLAHMKSRIKKLRDGRLDLPAEVPYTEAHNTWVANQPGTLLVIPVGDLSQHLLLNLCYFLQNGIVLTDDIHQRPIPGVEKFKDIVDVNNTWPLSFVETWSLSELTVELGASCYAGTLILQAMGLGGWMFNGVDYFSVLGAAAEEGITGIGFRCDTNDAWPTPNPTGLEGVMEGFCPPHYENMRAAVEALCERKFGPGGPFNADTPGPWKDSAKVRASAQIHDEQFRECIALQAQYIYDTFGRFPGTVPTMFAIMYLQAHHLDLEFYDHFYKQGSYLKTHKNHMKRWHG